MVFKQCSVHHTLAQLSLIVSTYTTKQINHHHVLVSSSTETTQIISNNIQNIFQRNGCGFSSSAKKVANDVLLSRPKGSESFDHCHSYQNGQTCHKHKFIWKKSCQIVLLITDEKIMKINKNSAMKNMFFQTIVIIVSYIQFVERMIAKMVAKIEQNEANVGTLKEYDWIFKFRDGKTKSAINSSEIFAMMNDTLLDHMEKILIQVESIYVDFESPVDIVKQVALQLHSLHELQNVGKLSNSQFIAKLSR